MTGAMGVGAVIGGLLVAARGKTGLRPLVAAAWVFGVAVGLAALAPSLALELVALALAGAASISFMATGNSTLQLNAAPSMRGRVMALWFVAFQGSTPIGGPIIGWVMAVLRRSRRARDRGGHVPRGRGRRDGRAAARAGRRLRPALRSRRGDPASAVPRSATA